MGSFFRSLKFLRANVWTFFGNPCNDFQKRGDARCSKFPASFRPCSRRPLPWREPPVFRTPHHARTGGPKYRRRTPGTTSGTAPIRTARAFSLPSRAAGPSSCPQFNPRNGKSQGRPAVHDFQQELRPSPVNAQAQPRARLVSFETRASAAAPSSAPQLNKTSSFPKTSEITESGSLQ